VFTPWRTQPVLPTAKADPIVDRLWGIRDYIALAEQDRFRALQGPDTAQRSALDVLLLNEKLLPYALLFGLEKEWMRQLDLQYRDLPPEVLADVGDLLVVVQVVGDGLQVVQAVAELATIVDAAGALEGVGAFFGGLGEALGHIDLPDIDLPDLG
jgi:hypothetical protein